MRIVKYTLLSLGIILFAGFILLKKVSRSGQCDYSLDVKLPGLSDTVKVYRDSTGMPHVYANSETDMYMAVGYLMAQDRMWQMDLLRRVTLGRLSEIFGDEFVQTDLLLRSLRFSDKSERILQTTDTDVVQAVAAFTFGVNSYIEEGNFPVEFKILGYEPEPWQPEHTVNLIGYMAWDLKSGWREYILEEIATVVDSLRFMDLMHDHLEGAKVIFDAHPGLLANNSLHKLDKLSDMGLDVLSGSNNWAVSGSKTTTGKPILANDMHLAFGIPGIWYQMHQVVKGKLNVSGLVLPGQPFVIVGHNDSIAWGMTNTYTDNLDFYEERIHPDDSNQYLLDGNWLKFTLVDEMIKIKGGREQKHSYRYNHRGPVVSAIKKETSRVLTIRWVGDAESDEIGSIYHVNRAGNWDTFREAFKTFRAISQNIAYADVRGNIGLQTCAGVPVRKRDNVFGVLPGWTSEYDWTGFVPFEELPYEFNPERGYVSSANNRTTDPGYPHHIGTWYALDYRITRIRQMLESYNTLGNQEIMAMQTDMTSVYAEKLMDELLPCLESADIPWNPAEKAALAILQEWDYTMKATSVGATLNEFWTYEILLATFADELGEELFHRYSKVLKLPRIAVYNMLSKDTSAWTDNVMTEAIETKEDIAIQSFRSAVSKLSDEYGTNTDEWEWGRLHKITFKHPLGKVSLLNTLFNLNRGSYRVGGSYHTVAPFTYSWFTPEDVVWGASHRSIMHPGNWEEGRHVLPTGISGVPESPYYCSQTEQYVTGDYNLELYDEETLTHQYEYTMNLLPE